MDAESGDRVKVTSGKCAGHQGTIEANVYQRTVDCPSEWANGYHIMLDNEKLVTVRWDQVVSCPISLRHYHGRNDSKEGLV